MLHLFDDVAGILSALTKVARPAGLVFLTSLVAETRIGKGYLSLLHRAGEVAAPRTRDQLLQELRNIPTRFVAPVEIACEGSVAFIVGRTADYDRSIDLE